ncbi:uncharacterized protein LOC132037815 isoform X2 [Lycium ferocissimum]|uniref:uncharacterized protein LOC132037815 isoform X2 n=1 Tax=Lycium ferocissimum TaxID=112874 RepID=UPI002815D005|nr:uncharacterized protein LOC132037815 isoform X2 [Lycium ferocissimum]
MDEDNGNSNNNSNSSITVDTAKWDRSVWLMKCPLIVSKSWQSQSSSSSDSPQVGKVIVSVDPLRSDDSSALQFTMEMGGNNVGNMPKSYSLNMFQDFVPMCVLSETDQGRVTMEGKVEHKFDMTPHTRNMEEYRKMCRERTNKSMIKNRQIQVIDNDRGVNMRPMPGMLGMIASSSKAASTAYIYSPFLKVFMCLKRFFGHQPGKAINFGKTTQTTHFKQTKG